MNAHHPFRETLAATEPLAGLLSLLRRCPSRSDIKQAIMALHGHGALADNESGALITGLMLETN